MSLEKAFKWFISSPLRIIAYPFAAMFYLIIKLKKFLAPSAENAKGSFVISIGNLDFGGTGKTPTILLLLEQFKNFPSAVVSRGYRSKLEHQGSTFVNFLDPCDQTAASIGDEPRLILSKFPNVALYVGKDKLKSVKSCKKRFVFLDDGAQSHSIKKDISLILVDAKQPISPLFPVGYRRDTLDTLKHADYILVPYCQNQNQFDRVKALLKAHTNAPICGFRPVLEIPSKSKKIALLTAIARPQRLIEQLEDMGYSVVCQKILDDHEAIKEDVLDQFQKEARKHTGVQLITTEKDFVKIPSSYKENFSAIKLTLIPSFDHQAWETFIGKIQKMS